MDTPCAAILLSLALASPALAAGPRAVRVTCRGQLPFDRAALVRAITLRLPLVRLDPGRLPVVAVRAVPPDGAAIRVGEASRLVSIRGLSGEDAARVVALLSLDLMLVQQATSPPAAEDAVEQPGPKSAARTTGRFSVGLSPRLSLGVVAWSPTFEPTLDLSVKVSRHFLIYLEAGFTWSGQGEGERALDLYEVPVRAGAGFRYAWLEVRAGAVVRPYLVSGGGEDSGVLAGGGLGLFYRHAFSPAVTGHAGVGVDLLYPRKEFRVGGQQVLTTSWAVPWLALGAGWQGG